VSVVGSFSPCFEHLVGYSVGTSVGGFCVREPVTMPCLVYVKSGTPHPIVSGLLSNSFPIVVGGEQTIALELEVAV
jgi:hypothetical protein